MNTNCCVPAAPHTHGSFEAMQRPVLDWQARLTAGLDRIIKASDQSLGHIEEEIARRTRDLERTVAEEVAQKKADQTLPQLSALRRQAHAFERRSRANDPDSLWAHHDPAGKRVVQTLQAVAVPRR